ncbi:MAG: Crp/Fnr family transcriptional regulator [Rhodospirillales bacterium]|nr:Crp/Fnr family transcriptional regulator [Rhodospirillales bacterium]
MRGEIMRNAHKVGAGDGPGESSVRDIELFSSLTDVDRRKVEQTLKWRNFATDETILNEHETDDDVYFVVEGNVSVLGLAESGRAISYASLEPGEFFGELAAIDKLPRSATVIANTPSVIALLPGGEFRRLVKSSPEVAYAVMEKLVRLIRLSNLRHIKQSDLGVRQRTCLELLRLMEPAPGDLRKWEIHPLPTQQELAIRIDATREGVGRILSQLSLSGTVRRELRTLHVLDRKKVEEMALSWDLRRETRRLGSKRGKAVPVTDNDQRSVGDRRTSGGRNNS